MTIVYKICSRSEWQAAEAEGAFRGSAVDLRDGFIHFSGPGQLAETAAKHFAKETDLLLIAVDAEALGAALTWERSRNNELFPHLYGALLLAAVRWARPLPDAIGGKRQIPELAP